MGITDVTAGGAQPIRVETPQVSSPAPRVPKTESKAPTQNMTAQAGVPSTADTAAANAAVTSVATANVVVQPKVRQGQAGASVGTVKDDAENGLSGERVSRRQRANRAAVTNGTAANVAAANVAVQTAGQGQQVKRQQEEKKEPTEQDRIMAEKAMENAKERLRSLQHNVRFGYNDDIERYTITITDAEDKQVVKEIPSEEIQKMIEHLHTMKGMMFDTEI